MKKVIINILLILTFIIVYLIQANIFTVAKIAGVMPNLFVIFILFIGLYTNKISAIVYGIFSGIAIDMFVGQKIGVTAIMLCIIGIIAVIFDKNFSKENRFTLMIMVAVSTIVYESGLYIINYFLNNTDIYLITFLKILSIESVYNMLLIIIIYPLIETLGYKIEGEYKGNRILTRYF